MSLTALAAPAGWGAAGSYCSWPCSCSLPWPAPSSSAAPTSTTMASLPPHHLPAWPTYRAKNTSDRSLFWGLPRIEYPRHTFIKGSVAPPRPSGLLDACPAACAQRRCGSHSCIFLRAGLDCVIPTWLSQSWRPGQGCGWDCSAPGWVTCWRLRKSAASFPSSSPSGQETAAPQPPCLPFLIVTHSHLSQSPPSRTAASASLCLPRTPLLLL